MKVLLEQKDLVSLVSTVQRAAAAKDTIPALTGMLLKVSNGRLIATAMDLEIGIRAQTAEVQAENEGEVLVNAKHLDELVKRLPEGVITLEQLDNKLGIRYGRNCAKINILTGAEVVKWPCETIEDKVSIPQEKLKDALQKTVHAVAQSHFRQVFTGLLIEMHPGEVRFVGSDTHRLAYYRLTINDVNDDFTTIVPAKAIQELLKQLKGEEPIAIGTGTSGKNKLLVFHSDDFEMYSREIEGQFPNYLGVIPQSFVSSFKFSVPEFQEGLQRIETLPENQDKIKQLNISIKESEALLVSTSDLAGEVKETCTLKEQQGDLLEIAFNAKYFHEALRHQPEETLIKFAGPRAAAVLQGSDEYLVVLVPLSPKSAA